ncbi:NAD-dependent glycerol-3-phosphate dehydrogenase C-terminus [Rhizoctonia solani]|uniref:Glycerol-3-phosphate dehydrogenase [NAD(+)] n=1 Tax=Rhizoctonia solani TaxID=456999 RepID=A0A8H8SZW0_9AGAM|nr:NAD-dependent glycerol-3-phosphate dehydrogenase C-terminus [Rhizoctonia solani]QRW24731.1 NAD-dependent glycerol-3-phosphate dehydrogenase C-terminus [Rhizoctonia solani]
MTSTSKPTSRVLVLGAGNFGSCLADHLADSTHRVYLWARSKQIVDTFNKERRNEKYLTDHVFPEGIDAIGPELPSADFLNDVDVVLFAVPTQGLRKVLEELHPRMPKNRIPLMIFVNKGIEAGSQALTLEIIAESCGPDVAKASTFISGPSFAKEIVKRQPTTVSVSSLSLSHAQQASDLFHQPWFRCYTGADPLGVELAGALKNVYAIAAGIADGLGYENNTRAGLITRALAEMTRIGSAYGASPLTFLSLAGIGDLMLTCTSSKSRNYTVGYRLGKGEQLDHIIRTLGSVAEGVTTSEGLKPMTQKLGVYAPIADGVYSILYEGRDAKDVAIQLMNEPPLREIDLPQGAGAPVEELKKKLGVDSLDPA